MIRSFAAAGALVFAIGLATAPTDANADASVTISGPSAVAYYSTATLSGRTPAASQSVTVEVRNASEKSFRAFRTVTSSTRATFEVPVRVSGTFYYFATAGTSRSATHAMSIVRATCTTSAPQFASPSIPPKNGDPSAAFLTAGVGNAYAGYIQREPNAAIYRWSPGRTPRIVLSLRYPSDAYGEPSLEPYVVVTPHARNVVASVQRPGTHGAQKLSVVYIVRGDTPHLLASSSTWSSFEVGGVGPDGSIYGRAQRGTDQSRNGANLRFAIVRWNESGTTFTYLTSFGPNNITPIVDDAGDWTGTGDGEAHLAHGGTVYLDGVLKGNASGGQVDVGGPGGFYGDAFGHLEQWVLSDADRGMVRPRERSSDSNTYQVIAADRRGAVLAYGMLAGGPQLFYLITASGAVVRPPAQQYSLYRANFLDADRGLAFTDLKGYVRFFRCT